MVEKDELFDHLAEMLRGFKAKYGIYAVFGAHDYYNKRPAEFLKNMFRRKESYERSNDTALLIQKLEKIGISVLLNDSRLIEGAEDFKKIEIIGADDPIIGKTELADAFSKVEKEPKSLSAPMGCVDEKGLIQKKEAFALSQEKAHALRRKDHLRIALIHTPDADVLTAFALNDVDIVFAGHTHGGQIRLPGAGAIIAGCNLSVKYTAGLFYFKQFVLQVSRGLGEGRYSPFRVFCSPEAIFVTIYKTNPKN
jgi:predicted MPP superfamily phosphohydrolase